MGRNGRSTELADHVSQIHQDLKSQASNLRKCAEKLRRSPIGELLAHLAEAAREAAEQGDESIRVSVTCIRVPVLRAHCESINLTFAEPITEQQVRDILSTAPGVRVVDDRKANKHPEPLDATGGDDVLVGRIRTDLGQDGGVGVEMFIAGDQIRKGAALNAVQIAELLLDKVPA
jgi:aspartate-semialdehyde dehydrogenase